MRTVSSLIAAGFTLGLSSQASAGAPGDPAVSYRAPGACPTQESFHQRLRARLAASQAAARLDRALDVQIESANGRYIGTLTLAETDGRSTTKTLSDADCEALVDALALVAALAVETDGDAAGRGGNSAGARAHASPPATGTAPAAAPTPASTTASTTATARPPGPASGPAPTPASATPTAPATATATEATGAAMVSESPSRVGVGASGLVTIGPAPNVLVGGALTLHWAGPGAGLLRPVLELGGAASLSPDAPESRGTASFAWFTAHAAVYLLQWPPGSGVVLRAGLAGDFGVLLARGHDTASPATSSRPWGSLGAVVGLEVPLGARFSLAPALTLQAPLRRDRYAFGSTDFFEVPPVIAQGQVSIVGYFR